MDSENENNIVSRIPREIIVKILSYLPATYRKQARLVCSKWYEASNDIKILKRQKYILPKFYKTKMNSMMSMLHTLRKSGINYYNLEFECDWITDYRSFNEQINLFIKTHGSMIHSLSFRWCSISFETLEQIIIKCTNLEELIFVDGLKLYDSKPSSLHIPIVDGVEIKREKLKILEFLGCEFMTDQLLTIFINVYPNVKSLALALSRLVLYNKEEDLNTGQPSHKIISYHHFYRIVSQECQNIEKLNLANTTTYGTDIDLCGRPTGFTANNAGLTDDDLARLASTSCFKLKELNLSYHISITTKGFKNFLSQQRNLISVDVSGCKNFDFQCFNLLLDQNQNLEYVKVELSDVINRTKLFNALEKSRLKSFECIIRNVNILRDEPISNGKQHTLKKFTFAPSPTLKIDEFLGPILKMCCNLTYLDLSNTRIMDEYEANKISSYIFRNMIHLQTVILMGCDSWINDASFVHSTGRLGNLQHLDLSGCTYLREYSIENFYYPKLKYLNLSRCININDYGISFAQLVETSPLIEELELSGIDMQQKTVMMICQKFKYLRRLLIDDAGGLRTCSFCKIFSSSLRRIEGKSRNGSYFFNYNHQTNSLVEEPEYDEY